MHEIVSRNQPQQAAKKRISLTKAYFRLSHLISMNNTVFGNTF